jgi:hypothetical protein
VVPATKALLNELMSSTDVTMMMGKSAQRGSLRIRAQVSMPSMSGMTMSSSTISALGDSSELQPMSSTLSASQPEAAVITSS